MTVADPPGAQRASRDGSLRAPALGEMTWPDVAARAEQVLVLPVGSLEQHGPHLPLDTDTRVARALAGHLAAARQWPLAPAVTYGASGEHADFPGTLSIGRDALSRLVVELVRSARRTCRGVVVVSGHGGNHAALMAAAEMSGSEGDPVLVWHARVPGGDAHAGRTETSMVLALAPEAVRMERARPGRPEPLGALLPALTEHGVRAVSPNGVLGDPMGATAAEGRAVLDRLRADLVAEADAWWASVRAAGAARSPREAPAETPAGAGTPAGAR